MYIGQPSPIMVRFEKPNPVEGVHNTKNEIKIYKNGNPVLFALSNHHGTCYFQYYNKYKIVYISKGGKVRVMKLLSVDPSNYPDAPREGIRRILEEVGIKYLQLL